MERAPVAGIICEYNPFHEGHRYQMAALRQRLGPDTRIICAMSGNYVQRGEPAAYDKWTRAGAALQGGADLVLELPITAAINGGGYFAQGGVDALHSLGVVDYLVFGSEGTEAERLIQAAELLTGPDFDGALRAALTTGVSYPRAREMALKKLGGDPALLRTPNNALGVDYLVHLKALGSEIKPLVIPRADLPAASDIRRELKAAGLPIHSLENGERALLAVLRTLPEEAFEAAPFGSEGLWSKVMKARRRADTVEELILLCKSKRYTYSRLRRMLLCLFLGLTAADLTRPAPYLRVLGFNPRGRSLLRRIKKTGSLPLVTGRPPATPEAKAYHALLCRTTDLYSLFAPPGERAKVGEEQTRNTVVVE